MLGKMSQLVIMIFITSIAKLRLFFFLLDDEILFFTLFIFYSFIHMYIHVWAISLPHHPSLPGRTCSALLSNFVEEKT
jgi:hypothetical protein